MKNIEEKASLCALGRIFGFEPKTGLSLISHLGGGREVFRMEPEMLDEILGPYSRHRALINEKAFDKAYQEMLCLERQGIDYVGITEEEYPPLLKECEDAPIGLYIRSETPADELWLPQRKIAIVGTRDISPYGREWCEKLICAIASADKSSVIISGMALGTDICAHRTALENGIPTIGVMATGPESIYPWRNRSTGMQMVSSKGCALVTDYPPGTAPLAIHFLRRNRIIAGMSEATILIESKIKGGGMMTSRLAFSYNREVFALPGRVDDIRSQGCNRLIQEKIAEPLISIEEFLSSLNMKKGKNKARTDLEILQGHYGGTIHNDKIPQMEKILKSIRRNRGISIEELAADTDHPYFKTANICNLMESDGIITIDLLTRCSINAKK